ncbi:MAG: valine--tRNA ligase [Candidatus Peregrinibacteria bacterium]|nr:valine--tRNA ligase [Candidatus Peregrinibacteria bacterium]
MTEIAKAYNAKAHEDAIYAMWGKSGKFTPEVDPKKKPFTISLPPPNATGQLHLGHATMLAIEDAMIRYKRMQGFSALWVPGTDHAAIATQNKVEKIIAEEGKTRQSMGREKFLDRVKEYVADSQDTIRNQMRKMGASVDWTRERYTFDDGLSHAVRTAFTKMYQDGLIYRGHRIVNWCTRCHSTLADDEVEYKEEKTKFYYIKYGPVTIGTARPETKFHDKIIVVHPDDERYKDWVGKELMVPWITGEVKATFVADEAADMEMGSGAMTITPAHSFVDFDLAKKYDFEVIQIIDEDGKITEKGGPDFEGMNAKDAREKVVKVLQEKGLMERIDKEYVHNLSVCYRCDTPIEPLVSEQWFIDVNKKVKGKSLKERSLEVVRNGDIKILPDRFNKTYFHWMENLRDWCISRQIWWGHRIPVWYCVGDGACKLECKDPIVSGEDPGKCPHCGSTNLKQDPDTLDTWFSSGLWTFSTLGWPEKTKELEYFHPTAVLETGYDILFFWVARMIILSTYIMDEVPFETVYLHGLIRDKQGRKMSKSIGNGIDPLEMIEKYGTDAVRLSLLLGSSPGNDMRLYEEKIAGYRNFVNKIWNSARFILMSLDKTDLEAKIDLDSLTLADKWILQRMNEIIETTTKANEEYKLSEAGTAIYEFFWNEFCDWYLEINKVEKNPAVLSYILKTTLKLLHPLTPFVTEVLWEMTGEKEMLMITEWPTSNLDHKFTTAKRDMKKVIEVITAIRQTRSEYRVEPAQKIASTIYGHATTSSLRANKNVIMQMARLNSLTIEKEGEKLNGAIGQFVGAIEIYLPLEELVDKEKEGNRLNQEIEDVEKYLKGLEGKLNNKGYLANADKRIIEQDRTRLDEAKERLANMKSQLEAFKI